MKAIKSTFGFFLVASIITLFTGCEDLLNQAGFSIYSDYQTISIPVEPMPAGEYEFLNYMESLDLDSILAASEYQDIKELSLYEATLEIANNVDSLNFDAFKSFEITISNNLFTEITVAELTDIPDGLSKLTLNTLEMNLMEYMHGASYELKIKGVLDEDLNNSMEIVGSVRYKVGFGI